MSRSAVLLEWLRKTLADRGLAVGPLSARSGIERRRLRRILSGSAEMTVEELLALTESLVLIDPPIAAVIERQLVADIDLNSDGINDNYSVCLLVTLEGVEVQREQP